MPIAMKNCLILGSGRSGSSMLAGALSRAGYYMGDHLLSPTEANPKGFFEDQEINRMNEELLMQVAPRRPSGWLGRWYRWRHVGASRWLAAVPLGVKLVCPPSIAQRIAVQTAQRPFCFKDPRFSYTLPLWRPFLQQTAFLCIFREPARTAQSIVKECLQAPYLRDLPMTCANALRVWTLMYQHILQIHRREGTWLFMHYDQVLDGSAVPKIECLLDVHVDRQFVEPRLKRSANQGRVGSETLAVYRQLCELAHYRGDS